MGIKDLLPSLKQIQKPQHVSVYEGQTLAIDGYCWLHQGAYHCAQQLVQGHQSGIGTLMNYCRGKLDLMINAKVKPILVFDGNKLIMKAETEANRQKNREDGRRKAEEALNQGNEQLAQRYFMQAVDITPDMAHCFMKILKEQEVEYFVAPYEADAQLTWLYQNKKADAVITEDSDLLPFGVKKCFFKMDRGGYGFEINLDDLHKNSIFDFRGFKDDMFITACILSGCDYLESIKGIGWKKAYKLVQDQGNDDIVGILKRIRRAGTYIVPLNYERSFEKALLTFKFQTIFNPDTNELEPLNNPNQHPLGPLLINYEDLKFLGEKVDPEYAIKICRGELDPISRLVYKDIEYEFAGEGQKMTVYQRGPSLQNKRLQKKREEAEKQSRTQPSIANLFGGKNSNKSSTQKSDNALPERYQIGFKKVKEKRVNQNIFSTEEDGTNSGSQNSQDNGFKTAVDMIQQKMKDRLQTHKQDIDELVIQNDIIDNSKPTPQQELIIGKRPLDEITIEEGQNENNNFEFPDNGQKQNVNLKSKNKRRRIAGQVSKYFGQIDEDASNLEVAEEAGNEDDKEFAPWAFNDQKFIETSKPTQKIDTIEIDSEQTNTQNKNVESLNNCYQNNTYMSKIQNINKSLPVQMQNTSDQFNSSYNNFMQFMNKNKPFESNLNSNPTEETPRNSYSNIGKENYEQSIQKNKNISKIETIYKSSKSKNIGLKIKTYGK